MRYKSFIGATLSGYMERSGPVADLILIGGRIWTGNASGHEAEAIAIAGDTISGVGTDSEILDGRGLKTQVVELKGRRVVPGFNDAHVHFSTGGFSLASVNLRNARSEEEFREILGCFAASRARGEWILQGEWDAEGWTSGVLPTRELIDDVTPDNPVLINRTDGHTALANTLAMQMASVDEHTRDVPFGMILRDADGLPNGLFVDAAQSLIQRAVPAISQDRFVHALLAAQDHAAAHGVTSVQDMGLLHATDADCANLLRAYRTLLERNELKVRVSLHMPLRRWQELAGLGIGARFGDSKLRIGALKAFADGSLGSHTAWFYEPYADAPHSRGMCSDQLVDPEVMYEDIRGADEAGLQLAIHAIGDRANNVILGFCERLQDDNGRRDRRVRIEHAQHLLAEDIGRFAQLGVIASVQPYHCIDDARFITERIGAHRSETAFAFRSLLDAGAVLAFGSDWWVAPMSPLMGIYAAVTRRTPEGRYQDGWMPAQRISVAEAVRAYTAHSAYASFDEGVKGSLEVGKLADMVVLSDDVFSIAASEIQNVKVDMTICDGAIVHDRTLAREERRGALNVR